MKQLPRAGSGRSRLRRRLLSRLLVYSLRHAERIIVLDRFMKQRIIDKGIAEEKITDHSALVTQ